MTGVLARLAGAWRVLRHGPPAAPIAPTRVVDRALVDELVDAALESAGLPAGWAATATTADLAALHAAAGLAAELRAGDWAELVAELAELTVSVLPSGAALVARRSPC